jgi:acetyl esterase/lipase
MERFGCKVIRSVAILAALSATALAEGRPGGEDAARKEGKPVTPELVEYKSVADVRDATKQVRLKLHVFKPDGHRASDRRPAIVFFFGGGWVGGTPKQFYPHCEYLASRGIVAMAAEYRVKSRNRTTPLECVKDGKSAVRYVRAHAKELGVDPARVASGGGSAGGHVAACTGVIEGHEEEGEDLKVSSMPAAMVLFNPGVGTPSGKGFGSGYFKEHPDLSPAKNVREGLPPTIIFHGTADTTVLFEDVEEFTALMEKAGNDCTLVPCEGQKHGFFNFGRGDSFEKTVTETDGFLARLGYLEGEPRVREFIAGRAKASPRKRRRKKK